MRLPLMFRNASAAAPLSRHHKRSAAVCLFSSQYGPKRYRSTQTPDTCMLPLFFQSAAAPVSLNDKALRLRKQKRASQ